MAAISVGGGELVKPARPMGTWGPWVGSEERRTKTCNLPETDWDSPDFDYDANQIVSPVPPVSDVDYTIVKCGYTSRIELAKLPNAILALDGLWGPNQRSADENTDKHLAILDLCRVQAQESFIFKAQPDIGHLMSFDHCGCFSFISLFKASLTEVTIKDENEEEAKKVRILSLIFDTESG